MTIFESIEAITSFWCKSDGAKKEDIVLFEQNNDLALPQDFKEFLVWSNGGQGKFPNIYIDLWKVEEFNSKSDDYEIKEYLGDKFIPIGSDGGPICFLLAYHASSSPKVVSANFGDLDIDEVHFISDTFTGFLKMAISGALVDDDL